MKVCNVNTAWRMQSERVDARALWFVIVMVLLHGEGEHQRWKKEEKKEEGVVVSLTGPP